MTDPSVHHLVAVPALAAGLHVICEKPLGITVSACRAILDAASRSGAVLATAENYRRDGPNRVAAAVLDQGLLGKVHLMIEANVGGDDAVVLSPWRHLRESGSIASTWACTTPTSSPTTTVKPRAGVRLRLHRRTVQGDADRYGAGGGNRRGLPWRYARTGEDSLVALYETASDILIQLCYLPSGPGRRWVQRSVHGRSGSMTVPPDRSGGTVVGQSGISS